MSCVCVCHKSNMLAYYNKMVIMKRISLKICRKRYLNKE